MLLMDNVKLDGITSNIKWKIYAYSTLHFRLLKTISSFEGTFYKKVARYSYQFLYFLLFFISFYISRCHFSQFFRTSFNIIRKKIFVTNASLLMNIYTGYIQAFFRCSLTFIGKFFIIYCLIQPSYSTNVTFY